MWRIALTIAPLLVPLPALAQATVVPAPPYYAMEPTMPLTPSARSPVQQQILENYRTQLQAIARDLLQQNPSGLGAAQLAIGRRLNAIGPGAIAAPPAAAVAAPAFSPTPFAGGSALPSPPFDAAPVPSAAAPR
jgi:hypothetical protein